MLLICSTWVIFKHMISEMEWNKWRMTLPSSRNKLEKKIWRTPNESQTRYLPDVCRCSTTELCGDSWWFRVLLWHKTQRWQHTKREMNINMWNGDWIQSSSPTTGYLSYIFISHLVVDIIELQFWQHFITFEPV